jgi:multiple sugar transport system substrate-binding protein
MKARPGGEKDIKRLRALEETITQYAMIPPKFPQYPLIEDILWSGVQQAMTGASTPKDSLLQMEKKVREVLT